MDTNNMQAGRIFFNEADKPYPYYWCRHINLHYSNFVNCAHLIRTCNCAHLIHTCNCAHLIRTCNCTHLIRTCQCTARERSNIIWRFRWGERLLKLLECRHMRDGGVGQIVMQLL